MRTTNVFGAIFGLSCINAVLAAPVATTPHWSAAAGASSSVAGAGAPTATGTGVIPVGTDGSDTSSTGNMTGPENSSGGGPGSGPWFAVYTDQGPDPAPAVNKIEGFNVVIMSFLVVTPDSGSNSSGTAAAWEQMSDSQRTTIKQQYKAAGIKLLISAFGSTDKPTSQNLDPKKIATSMAAWVKKYGVDGIDVDYEDIDAMNKADGKAEKWIIDFTTALRTALPQKQFLLTHAPMAPWMGPNPTWKSGAYLTVNKQVGSKIDFYNVQFYNQGVSEYTDCDGLLTKSSANPESSLFEIAANGFELNKLLIGKPGATADATNGQMASSMLATCVAQAKAKGWKGGVMSWQYPTADTKWITAVRGSAFPLAGASSSTGTADAASPTETGADTPSETDGGSDPASETGANAGSETTATGSASAGDPTATDAGSDTDEGSTDSDAGSGAGAASAPFGGASTGTPTAAPTGAPTGVPTSAPTGTKGALTPVATGTKSFNNGMWTPDAAHGNAGAPATSTGAPTAASTGKPAPKMRRSKVVSRSRMHMVRSRA